MTRIVLHGALPSAFQPGLSAALGRDFDVRVLPQSLDMAEHRRVFAAADILVAATFDAAQPRPERLSLLHLPNAGTDGIDFAALPDGAVVCNCFGHEQGIAEYVMAAMLMCLVPLASADSCLRQGDWRYRDGPSNSPRGDLAGSTIGLLGFGRIGRAVAARAKAFGMIVHVANRSPVAPSALVDCAFGLDRLADFWGGLDYLVNSLPLAPQTQGLVNARAFGAMRPQTLVINVGRGPTIDEQAFFEALRDHTIGGAVIDTWYQYPTVDRPECFPSVFPFHELANVTMTPHISGWTQGMIGRRLALMTDNIRRRLAGEPCRNIVWPHNGQGPL